MPHGVTLTRYPIAISLFARGLLEIGQLKALNTEPNEAGRWLAEYISSVEDNGFKADLFPSQTEVIRVLAGLQEIERFGASSRTEKYFGWRGVRPSDLATSLLQELSLEIEQVWPAPMRITFHAQVATSVIRAKGTSPWLASVFDAPMLPLSPAEQAIKALARDAGRLRMLFRKCPTRLLLIAATSELWQLSGFYQETP